VTIIEERKAKATGGGQRAGGEESGRKNGVHIELVWQKMFLKPGGKVTSEKKWKMKLV